MKNILNSGQNSEKIPTILSSMENGFDEWMTQQRLEFTDKNWYSYQLNGNNNVFHADIFFAMPKAVELVKEQSVKRVVQSQSVWIVGRAVLRKIKRFSIKFKIGSKCRSTLEDSERVIKFRWIPGHFNILKNEVDNEIARGREGGRFSI